MPSVGVTVQATEIPPANSASYNTANAFIPMLCDWGPIGKPIPVSSLANAASQIGTPSGSGNPYSSRTTTCATGLDAVDTLIREDGPATPTVYVSRVAHGTPVNASISLSPSNALTITALYPGAGGNGIYVACQNNTSSYTLSLLDSLGNVLAASPSLGSLTAGVNWVATTGYATATSSGSTLPATLAATAMTGGTDNRGSATISDWQTAIGAFSPTLGPGQILAPGQTNTTLPGIWSALGNHAILNNRVAICNLDDGQPASTTVAALGTFGTSNVASYCGFWAGNRQIPGVVASTTRSVSPDAVIAGLCAQVDAAGNPNAAAAGINYPLSFASAPQSIVSGSPYDTYSLADLETLNGAGINTFQFVNGQPCNYGYVSPELASSDQIYWQFNHSRLRMALVAQAQLVGQPFVFSQIDGQGSQQTAFKGALQAMLLPYATAGALWAPTGTPAASAFTVDTGSDVNTPATEAAGQLNATITVSFSYYAQNVNIGINVSPITQATV